MLVHDNISPGVKFYLGLVLGISRRPRRTPKIGPKLGAWVEFTSGLPYTQGPFYSYYKGIKGFVVD